MQSREFRSQIKSGDVVSRAARVLTAAGLLTVVIAATGCGENKTVVRTVTAPAAAKTPSTESSPSTSSTSTSTSDAPAKVGGTITLEGDATTLKVRVTSVIDPLPAGEYDTASDGKRYVGIKLAVSNVGDGAYSDSVSNGSTIVTRGDEQADSTIISGGPCGGSFGSDVKIAPGDKRVGCIPFEVPTGAKLRSFQFTPDSGFSDATGEWDIAGASTSSGSTGSSSSGGSSGSSGSGSSGSGFNSCDANIAAKGSTNCRFAENTFYEYFSHHGASSFSVYSPNASRSYTVQCSDNGGEVTCTTSDDAGARFSRSAIEAYSQDQADKYAATHDVGR